MSLVAALAVLLSWVTLIWSLNAVRWRLDQPVGLDLLFIGALVVVRPTVMVLGLDSPYPDEFFAGRDIGGLIAETQLSVIVWLLVYTAFARTFRPRGGPAIGVLRVPSDQRLAKVLPLVAAGSAIIVLPLWVRYGGFSGLTSASKFRTLGEGMRALRTPAALVAYLGAALAVARDPSTGRRRWSRRGWAAYLVGAFVSYTWGARDAAVYPLLFPLLAAMSTNRRISPANVRRLVRRAPVMVMGAVFVLLLGFGLRALRDITLSGEVQGSIAGQSATRQLAVATNHTRYDAMLLVVADTPDDLHHGGMRLVVGSLDAAIPSVLRPKPTTFVVPAITVAQHYVPSRKNGWPLTPPGDWYFALGVPGVALGAALSGFVAARLGGWQQRQRSGSRVAANALVLMWSTTVASGGLGFATPAKAMALIVPFMVLLVIIKRTGARPPSAAAADSTAVMV